MSENAPQPRPDGLVFYRFDHYGDRLEATTRNTAIYQHFGHLAVFDCVKVEAHFIRPKHRHYKVLLYESLLNECERHMGLRSVDPAIEADFYGEETTDLNDAVGLPEDWEDKPNEEGPSSPRGE